MKISTRNLTAPLAALITAATSALAFAANLTPLLSDTTYLGGPTAEWSIFEGRTPHDTELLLKFEAKPNDREHTLLIRHDDVKQDWTVTLNKKPVGTLFLMEADVVQTISIPPNALRDGENEIRIYSKAPDSILIHSISIADDSKTNLCTAGPIRIEITDAGNAPLPARITILDSHGSMAPFVLHGGTNFAARPGVIYTPDGAANFKVQPGTYTIFATRGPEYSMVQNQVTVTDEPVHLRFILEREVNTTNWVASDTHIHTLTLSRHGDALLHERLITLAAEAIELPIATEHNLHSDFSIPAKSAGLDKFFTSVPGNEVTTKRGHFNVFPVALTSRPADHNIEHWPDLLRNIRQSGHVRVAILNHPTDVHAGFTPFAATNFNRLTGKNLRGDFDFSFDAVEVINSGAMRSDWMEPFQCWFALLNRGYRITGVAASDSHDVTRFIVGQGRTYIRGADTNVANLNIPQLCESLKHGRAIASLGLFPQLAINDAPDALDAPSLTTGLIKPNSSGPGDLHRGDSPFFEITATIDFPTWINPSGRAVATLYENGSPKIRFPFEMQKQPGKPLAFKARFPKPKADAWYVLVAESPGLTNAYWSIARPYQPSSPEWNPTMIGATNPIYLDGNNDGLYTAPRRFAQHLYETYASPHDLIPALGQYDRAIALHTAEILHEARIDLTSAEFRPALNRSAPHVRQAFTDYLTTVSK